jgi:hypothetical protein
MDRTREIRELVMTLSVAAATVLALPWALWAPSAIAVVERLAIGLTAGIVVGAVLCAAIVRADTAGD